MPITETLVESARSCAAGTKAQLNIWMLLVLLGEELLVAHAVHVSESDARLLTEAGTAVVIVRAVTPLCAMV